MKPTAEKNNFICSTGILPVLDINSTISSQLFYILLTRGLTPNVDFGGRVAREVLYNLHAFLLDVA